jgi:thymidylate synthase
MSNRLDEQYRGILAELLYNGREKETRNGKTLSKFGMQIRHRMSDGFPLLTTKKMPIKTISTELLWFLKGDTNIKYLVDNGCNIWNGDCYKNYINNPAYKAESVADLMSSQAGQLVKCSTQEEFINKIKTNDKFAAKWGDLGPIYGSQWRSWRVGKGIETTLKTEDGQTLYESGSMYIDQIKHLLNELKTNPDSRRLMVNAWNVGEFDQMVLPPYHYGFQCYVVDGKLSLMWNQRSVDTFLGLPFNIASYGMLLMLLCKETGYTPGDLIGNLGDTHLYNNHIEQAKEQIERSSFNLPTITLSDVDILNGEFNFQLENYKSHPSIKAPLSN